MKKMPSDLFILHQDVRSLIQMCKDKDPLEKIVGFILGELKRDADKILLSYWGEGEKNE